jgi:hypothetical protein
MSCSSQKAAGQPIQPLRNSRTRTRAIEHRRALDREKQNDSFDAPIKVPLHASTSRAGKPEDGAYFVKELFQRERNS